MGKKKQICKRGHDTSSPDSRYGRGTCRECAILRANNRVLDPIYQTWKGIKQRCNNPNSDAYIHYGGRGITVCERWSASFSNFRDDMGERPEGMSLDRIDTNGNYEPNNCRWAGFQTQVANRRKLTEQDLGFLEAIKQPIVFEYREE